MAYVVFCTVPDEEVAERLARGLLEARLAACVNVLGGVRSFYRWQGAVQSDAELLMIIKTTKATFAALESWLLREHPYDVPEVVAISIEKGAPAYLEWLREAVGPAATE